MQLWFALVAKNNHVALDSNLECVHALQKEPLFPYQQGEKPQTVGIFQLPPILEANEFSGEKSAIIRSKRQFKARWERFRGSDSVLFQVQFSARFSFGRVVLVIYRLLESIHMQIQWQFKFRVIDGGRYS